MLHDPEAPADPRLFLESWAAEVRGGYTPLDALDVEERLSEYASSQLSPDDFARLRAAVCAASATLIAVERAEESFWADPTDNDRLDGALDALRAEGLCVLPCAGLTIQDGHANAGLSPGEAPQGLVFFHQGDVVDALQGEGLLLAFDVLGDVSASVEARAAVGARLVAALRAAGLPARWTGEAEDRVWISPFTWRRRRWTTAPTVAPTPLPAWAAEPRPAPRGAVGAEAVTPYLQSVRAYRTMYGFDLQLAALYQGVWRHLGGARGQVAHDGDPHVFVRAGGLTTLRVRDAFANLEPATAAAIRARAMACRPNLRAEGPALVEAVLDQAKAARGPSRSVKLGPAAPTTGPAPSPLAEGPGGLRRAAGAVIVSLAVFAALWAWTGLR